MNKKLIKKVGYLRAIIIMFPLSLLLVVFGTRGISTNLDELDKRSGIIENIKYSDNTVYIKLKSENFYYETSIDHKVKTIKNQIDKGDKVVIYKRKGNSKFIKRIETNGEILIDYKTFNKGALFILIIGIIFLAITILYIVKYPHHLWGSNK